MYSLLCILCKLYILCIYYIMKFKLYNMYGIHLSLNRFMTAIPSYNADMSIFRKELNTVIQTKRNYL